MVNSKNSFVSKNLHVSKGIINNIFGFNHLFDNPLVICTVRSQFFSFVNSVKGLLMGRSKKGKRIFFTTLLIFYCVQRSDGQKLQDEARFMMYGPSYCYYHHSGVILLLCLLECFGQIKKVTTGRIHFPLQCHCVKCIKMYFPF